MSTQVIDLFEALKQSLEENPIMPETNKCELCGDKGKILDELDLSMEDCPKCKTEPVLLSAEEWGEYNVAREAFDAWKKRRDKARAACTESFQQRWGVKLLSALNECQLTDRSRAQLERYMASK